MCWFLAHSPFALRLEISNLAVSSARNKSNIRGSVCSCKIYVQWSFGGIRLYLAHMEKVVFLFLLFIEVDGWPCGQGNVTLFCQIFDSMVYISG